MQLGSWLMITESKDRALFSIVLAANEKILAERADDVKNSAEKLWQNETFVITFIPMETVPCFILDGPPCAILYIPMPNMEEKPPEESDVVLQ